MKKVFVIALNLIFVLATFCLGRIYFADIYSKRSQSYLEVNQYESALNYANRAVKLNPFEPSYYRRRAKIKIVSLVNAVSGEKQFLKESALVDFDSAVSLNEDNLVTLRDLVPLYYFLSIEDVSKPFSYSNLDEKYFSLTKDYYKSVKNKYKDDLGVVILVAKYEKKLGMVEEYSESLQIIENLRKDLLEWYPDLID